MVMENEIRLGDILDKLTPSDRLVIYNAARQVVYRAWNSEPTATHKENGAGHGNIQSNRTDVGLGKDRQTAGTDTS